MELIDNIQKWLAKNGYPLEMQVAKEFKNAGFDIEQSEYYQDRETDTFRELDIIASTSRQSDRAHYSVRTLIECKFCKSNPWLLFTEPGDVQRNFKLIMHPGNALGTQMTSRFVFNKKLWDLPIFSKHAVTGYAVVESMRKNDKKDNSYAALMGLSKGLNAFSNYPKYTHAAGKGICEVFLAVAVISGKLFRVFLDETNGTQIEEIERGSVVWSNPVCGNRSCVINIVTDVALPEFCQELKKSSDALWDTVIEDGKIDKKAKSLAWDIRDDLK